MRRFLVGAGTILALASSSCSEADYADREQKLVEFVESNQTGSPDYWIVTDGPLGKSRIGLIFGFPDDEIACLEAVKLFNEAYPNRFLCAVAN